VREYFLALDIPREYLVALCKKFPQYLTKNEKGKIFYMMWMCLFVRKREFHV
jgi:hypothetical protein